MKARILAAILLMFTFTAAYNQTSRRGERNNDNNKQQTERKEQNKEATKTERPAQAREENAVRRSNSGKESQRTERVKPDNNNRTQQEPAQTTSRRETRTENKESNNRSETRQSRKDDNNKRATAPQEHRMPERRVVVHEYNREPQRRVVVRDNRQEERTYVRIDRPVRKVVVVNHPKNYRPVSVEYRRVHSPYRVPVHTHVYWSVSLHNDFRVFYPEVRAWRYDIGYQLPAVPAYDADYYIGDVARVYGRVSDIYYERETDEYYLYFGDYFPYHDFSVVINGREARAFSRRPERFFRRANLAVTGYITDYEEKPEIVVRRASQIELY
jgi:hypothetical protein